MVPPPHKSEPTEEPELTAQSHPTGDPSFLRELWWLVRTEKRWWLVPLVGSLAVVAALAILAAAPAAPFIYTLF